MAGAKVIKPIAGWDVIVHRGGFGVLLLKHLPGFPGTNVGEEEAARAIATMPFALKPEQCEDLANDLNALAEQLRARERPAIGRRTKQAKALHS
jgi:hypothetical protein